MKIRFQNVITALMLFTLLVLMPAGCVDDSADNPLSPLIGGSLIAVSECGGFPARDLPVLPTNQSAVEWYYDGEGMLKLYHLNAAFYCCPEISCRITSIGNTITVKEIDKGMCDCMCLADALYHVTGLSPGNYDIRFDEMSVREGDQLLEFSITIGHEPASGSFVVDRDHYPWYTPTPSGRVINSSTCGGFDDPGFPTDPPTDSNCIAWEYDDNRLSLRHTNAVFNCCIDLLTAVIEVTGDHITITEDETGESLCYCICLYDIDMDIHDLALGAYRITVITPYRDEPIEFIADLAEHPEGYYCYGTGMQGQ